MNKLGLPHSATNALDPQPFLRESVLTELGLNKSECKRFLPFSFTLFFLVEFYHCSTQFYHNKSNYKINNEGRDFKYKRVTYYVIN